MKEEKKDLSDERAKILAVLEKLTKEERAVLGYERY